MNYIKYPRTFHLPWSPGVSDDDKVLTDLSGFDGKRVVVTMKMDGENTTMYSDHIHARSIDSKGGADRDWVKAFWAGISRDIPENWRICGENLWAKHSIHYTNLESYFLAFSIWDENNFCLSWDDTTNFADMLGLKLVPVIYDGLWDEHKISNLHKTLDEIKDEGFVVRIADSFHYNYFNSNVAKYVRKGHVQTDSHWRHSGEFIPNILVG